MGGTIKRVGKELERAGSTITGGIFESQDPPPIPSFPTGPSGDQEVSAEDRRRIATQKRKQGAKGRQGTILGGGIGNFQPTALPSATVLGE